MARALDSLRAVMARDDTVLFIGSGLSAWSGLPMWTALIEALRDELIRLGRESELVDRELGNQDLLLAASYGVDQLNPQERRNFLRSAITLDAQPSEAHELIVDLGPSCYITTNYDCLLERALSRYRPGEYFDVVTPAHTLEIPSIIRARADHFVFKPHGDIGNAESVVLTREDYRKLQAENRAVFDAMRTLLASRPVVYIGFGLRDPDFLLMRDLLFSTFGSNPSDHFAIMPDVHDTERAYWIRHYGIDLTSYEVDRSASLDRQHAKLLDLLREIAHSPRGSSAHPTATVEVATLTLARYARGLHASIGAANGTDFPLILRGAARNLRDGLIPYLKVNGEAVATLSVFEGHLVIEGPPGAGKSHMARKLTRYLAEQLEAACLTADGPDPSMLRVPVLVPMRDYRGSILELLESALPMGISIDRLLENNAAVIILDGLNEAPVAGDLESTLTPQVAELLSLAGEATVLITTRFAGQLSSIDIPVATLDAVAEDALSVAIDEAGVDPTKLNPVTFDLLRRPFFYSAWKSGQVTIAETQSIHDVYSQVISGVQARISAHFGVPLSLPEVLARVAHGMVDSGDLSAPLANVMAVLGQSLPPEVAAEDFYRFLVANEVLIPTPLRRLAFYHHSITEYLAANHLAQRITQDPSVVLHCLGRKDWDQTLLMCLAFLDPALAYETHVTIMKVDAALGLRGLHYVEVDQEQWIERSLVLLPRYQDYEESYATSRELVMLPLSERHLPMLDDLSRRDDVIGGTAAALLCLVDPNRLKEVLSALIEARYEFNYCTAMAQTLTEFFSGTELLDVIEGLQHVAVSEEDEAKLLAGEEVDPYIAVQSGLSELLRDVPAEALMARASGTRSALVKVTVAESIRYRREEAVTRYLRQEVMAGHDYAIVDHYFQLSFGEPSGVTRPPAEADFLNRVIDAFANPWVGRWAVDVLRLLAQEDPHVIEVIDRRATIERYGLTSCMLHYVKGESGLFFSSLIDIAESGLDLSTEPTHCLEVVRRWDPAVLLRLLRRRDVVLATPLLEAIAHPGTTADFLDIDIIDIDWWLDWLNELPVQDYWPVERLGSFLARQTSVETRQRLIDAFNSRPAVRQLLATWVLRHFTNLTRADLVESAIDWVFGNVGVGDPELSTSIVRLIATEELVQERLLPRFLSENDPVEKAYLVELLQELGRRHGRRYVGDDGELLP
jgi:hypothetical protein